MLTPPPSRAELATWLGEVLILGRGRKLTDFPEPIPCSHASDLLSARSATLELHQPSERLSDST
jgi:hypothetical protein